jgi:hypothetical protein
VMMAARCDVLTYFNLSYQQITSHHWYRCKYISNQTSILNTRISKMAPLAQLLHLNPSNILTSGILHKRDSSCTYYDTSCSTHRLAIMIIIICVGILVSAILSLLYVRSRRSKIAKLRASTTNTSDRFGTWQATTNTTRMYEVQQYGAPPPYEPRRPERAARGNREWR